MKTPTKTSEVRKMLLAIITALVVSSGCASAIVPDTGKSEPTPRYDLTPQESVESSSAIRAIDFGNVTYPNFPNYDEGSRRITLKAGEAVPAFVEYGDATGDGQEEAFVVFPNPSHGTAITYYIYIFAIKEGKLTLLWDFEGGDRGDGGVRRIYSQDGKLTVELYGKDKVIGRLYEEEESVCCPSTFTRARYEFAKNEFRLIGSPEILPNPSEDNSVLMAKFIPRRNS